VPKLVFGVGVTEPFLAECAANRSGESTALVGGGNSFAGAFLFFGRVRSILHELVPPRRAIVHGTAKYPSKKEKMESGNQEFGKKGLSIEVRTRRKGNCPVKVGLASDERRKTVLTTENTEAESKTGPE
jgi:hypothetical protein